MKQFISISVFFFFSMVSYGQISSVVQSKPAGIYLPDGTKVNEYKKTFEIKENANPDQMTLSKIDVSKYWKFINPTQRVEVIDDVTDLTLILYSRSESNALIDFNTVLVILPPESGNDQIMKSQ